MDASGANLLDNALAQALRSLPEQVPLAVGLSAGPDSSALAVCLSQWCQTHQRTLYLFHVHHGLSDQADQWLTQVQTLARCLERPLVIRRVVVDLDSGVGVEGAARQARRRALTEMANEHGVQALLLAHHQQDQAETVLMRLLRGSGVQGLSAMAPMVHEAGLCWIRPWLDLPRQQLLDYLQVFSDRTHWQPVDDPSNRDGNLARGALRTAVIPAIESHWPAWRSALTRHAKQAAQTSRLLGAYGQHLLRDIEVGHLEISREELNQGAGTNRVLSLAKWREQPLDEQALIIRTWFAQAGVQMPTEKRLNELLRQLRQVHALGHDRELKWQQSDCEVRCLRGQLHLRATL